MRRTIGVLLSLVGLWAHEEPRTIEAGTGTVTGMIIDDGDGRPIAAVAVGVRNSWEVLFPGSTGADGRFSISGVKSGTYFLDARKRGYIPYYVEPIVLFDVRPGGTVRLAPLRLTATGVVSGTVLDPWGDPIKGAFVCLLTKSQIESVVPVWRDKAITTDDRGAFTIPEVRPGRYIVEAGATNRYGGAFLVQGVAVGGAAEWREANYSSAHWKMPGTSDRWSEIVVGPKSNVSNLRLQLGWDVGAPVRPDVERGDSTFRVQILDAATGKPVPRAQLALWHLPAITSDGSHVPIISTIGDDSGAVSLSGLARGEYDVYVERIGYRGASFTVHSAATLIDPVPLKIDPVGVSR